MVKNLILGVILVRFGPFFISTECHTLLQAIVLCNFKQN